MKVAIIHDWLDSNSGAERVLKSIVELYPNADIFVIVDFFSEENKKKVFKNNKITSSFISKLPFAKTKFRNYLPLFPLAIESFDLSSYHLIISSSWAFAKSVKKTKSQTHICYCHTPIRYAWDLYDEYTHNLPFFKKIIVQLTLKYIRKFDLKSSHRVDYFIANSQFVANRIKKTYNRNSTVIYPPVNTNFFKPKFKKKNFYLTACRLVKYKKTKMIVESFNQNGKNLVVIGIGEELEEIKQIAKPNIQVLGYQSNEKLLHYMQQAKAFVYMAIEDFGIVPIEAMSCATPVIALDKGGTKESIIDGQIGIKFKTQSIESLNKAIEKFEEEEFNLEKIREYSLNFEQKIFISKFKNFINSLHSTP